ncbi:unnamed protein product [Gongylonema pulchrum]|uniref:Uncharacterized protein n=1 Tax=Gongylonema pulchrum TaxID=637853 RepID=A0A3P7RGN3_9BILA|nr:unnamed protein product [Gongylonema pulchrum]
MKGNISNFAEIDWLADCVTPVARDTRVHACTEKPSGKEDCFYEDGQSVVMKKDGRLIEKLQMSACWLCRPDCKIVRVIRPSTIWFASRNEINAVGYENDRFCRLLYSGHASLSEVETAFSLLRPAFAYPNTASELNKDFVKYLSYFRPYCSGHSKASVSSTDDKSNVIDIITLSDSLQKSRKRKASFSDDEDCQIIG